MKKINVIISAAILVSMMALATPASAQTPDTRTTTSERYTDDSSTNYSWVGLLGLLGLAGLVRRNNIVRESSTQKYNA